MHSVSTTNTWTVCLHFSSTASVVKLLSRVDKSLIICTGQFISTSKKEERKNAQHREKETLEEKVQETFVEFLPKDQTNANWWISLCRKIEQVKKT